MENEKNLKEISEETTPAEEVVSAEETLCAEATEVAEETVPAEETVCEEAAPAAEEKKATPGKMALVIAGIVVVLAVIAALLFGGKAADAAQSADPAEDAQQTEAAVPTIPADGNPDDYTCKGTYTVSDEEAKAAAETVVAVIGDHELTNGKLQTLYWMQVQTFLSSEYGSYMQYYGLLDYTQPLDTQRSPMAENATWQQFLLGEALNTWQQYCALADKAAQAEMTIPEADQQMLDGIEESLEVSAAQYGLSSGEELLRMLVGAGASVDDYRYCQKLLMEGNLYYDTEYAKLEATAEEIEAFFAEHEAEYAESGITRDGKYVDVRHILLKPQSSAEDGVTITEEDWEACRVKAEELLKQWQENEPSEESFAELAKTHSEDPGSQSNGGLYENVYTGQMVAEFDGWCFDESRQIGDSGLVKTTYGYHLMYFVDSEAIWESYARQDVITDKITKMMEQIVAEYPMEVSYKDIVLGYVNMAG